VHPYPSRARRGRQSGSATLAGTSSLEVALDYLDRGFCPIPQQPGAKMPCVKWKPFQEVQPEVADLEGWFAGRFATAGIALVLGPAFGLMVVDVDGEEALSTLVERLGGEPEAPTVMSGSGDPYRRHYYFRHPPVSTKAKYCPWHRSLEFRGHRGIVVAPPSLHKSGNRYRWADGKSLDDLSLPEVPGSILAALEEKASTSASRRSTRRPRVTRRPPPSSLVVDVRGDGLAETGLCLATRQFLGAVYADDPGWNDRLFRAAADMAGCGFGHEEALPRLLAGAGPWTGEDDEAAQLTIASAFAAARQPARTLAARGRPLLDGKRGEFTITLPKNTLLD
jgi:hypothetical protein